ncbi:MAG: sugar ABC transporter substrate-binding protein [Rectinemataceae bacterium]
MKNRVAIVLTVSVLLAALAFPAGAQTTKTAGAKKIRIGAIYLALEAPVYQAISKHAKAYAATHGIDLVELDGKFDQSMMTTQMENLVASKVDGIVYCLLEGKSAAYDIAAAQKKNIAVATFAIHHDSSITKAPFVGLDEREAGRLGGVEAGKYYKKTFGNAAAKIGVVEMSELSASTVRSDGFIEGFLSEVPKALVVARVNGEGKKDKAMAVTEDLIQRHPELNVIYGANGDQGLGALAALEAQGRGTIATEMVISHDGSESEVLKLIDPKSALKIAIANQAQLLANAVLDVTMEMIQGKRPLYSDAQIIVPPKILRGDNPDDAIKFINEQYFGNLSK